MLPSGAILSQHQKCSVGIMSVAKVSEKPPNQSGSTNKKSVELTKQGNSVIVKLNVGGIVFVTTEETLQSIPNTLLASLSAASASYDAKHDAHFFDRDPGLFTHILNVYRWGELHVPTHVCPTGFRKELEFWGIPEAMIVPCCLKTLFRADEEISLMEKLEKVTSPKLHGTSVSDVTRTRKPSWKMKIWLFLDDPWSSRFAKIWFFFYQCVVLLSVIVYLLWMIPSLRVESYFNIHEKHEHNNSKISAMVQSDPHPVLFFLDCAVTLFFTVELTLHFGVCPNKLKFFKHWLNVLNVLLVCIMLTSLILEIRKDLITNTTMGIVYYVFKNLNMFRLAMLVRLQKEYMGLRILILSIVESRRELVLMAVAFFIAVLIYAGLIFCAEIHSNMFPDIWVSLWWAIITMTTVGYGDFYPTDLAGRIVGACCAITGLLLLALPIAIIASNFADYYARKDYYPRLAMQGR